MNTEEIAQLKAAAEKWAEASEKYDRVEITVDELVAAGRKYNDMVRKPADILALLAEREADKKRIAELEARTLRVKFSPIPMDELGNRNQGKKHPYMFGAGYACAVIDCERVLKQACDAEGIKLTTEAKN